MLGWELTLGLEPVVDVAPGSAATLQIELVRTSANRLFDGLGGGPLLLFAHCGRLADSFGHATFPQGNPALMSSLGLEDSITAGSRSAGGGHRLASPYITHNVASEAPTTAGRLVRKCRPRSDQTLCEL